MNKRVEGVTLSVIIPCYNSEEYMVKAVHSVLQGGHDDIEILIINDGSTDRTGEIADALAAENEENVLVLHQPNKGHGGAVNTGLRHAGGTYIKVLDSDDWFDTEALDPIMDSLRRFVLSDKPVDLLITNYVYEKEGALKKRRMRYGNVFSPDQILDWDDAGKFRYGQYLMMHSLIYRTDVIRQSGLVLPEHTFYVDNLFVNVPLPYIRSLYYLDVDLYRYYIGRGDQSVNESVMIKRIDQQLLVNRMMIDNLIGLEADDLSGKMIQILYHHLEIVTSISSVLLIKAGDRKSLLKKESLWNYIKQKSPYFFQRLRRGVPGVLVNLSGSIGRTVIRSVYIVAQRVVGFN